MSSIKRDVKKKLLPRPGEKIIVSRSSPLSRAALDSPERGLLWLILLFLRVHFLVVTMPIGSASLSHPQRCRTYHSLARNA